MAALYNRADHYIFALWFLLSFYLFFFPRLISAVGDWMSTILLHMVWPNCEFRMQVWNVLHAARWKCKTQKSQKFAPGHHRTNLSGYMSSQLRKKTVKQQCLPHMSSQYGERRRHTSGWDQWVSRLGSVTARHSSSGRQPNFGVEQRAPPIFGRAAITLSICPHSNFVMVLHDYLHSPCYDRFNAMLPIFTYYRYRRNLAR